MSKPVTIRVAALARILRVTGVGEAHFTLAEAAVWSDPGTDRAADEAAWQAARRAGLMNGAGLDPSVVDALAVLSRPAVEYYGWITHKEETMVVLAAAIGREAIVAARIGRGVRLVPADADRLPESLIEHLPRVRAGRGRSINLPRSRVAERPEWWAADGEVAPFAHLATVRRTGSGELYAAVRDRATGRRRETRHAIGYLDTVEGRWLVQVVPGHAEDWLTAAPATPDLLVGRLREAHRALSR